MKSILLLSSLLLAASTVSVSSTPAVRAGSSTEPTRLAAPAKTGSLSGQFISKKRLKTRGPTSERDVVLYLKSKSPQKHAAPKEPAVVLQEKLQFSPHVIPLLIGSKVSFQNKDQVDHNVFASEPCCCVDSTAGPGKEVSYQFDKPGVASIVCRLHPDMSVWVMALEEPWFTSVELNKEKSQEGNRLYRAEYSIADIPAGEYSMTFWNKKLQPETRTVVIKAGEATSFDFVIESD